MEHIRFINIGTKIFRVDLIQVISLKGNKVEVLTSISDTVEFKDEEEAKKAFQKAVAVLA